MKNKKVLVWICAIFHTVKGGALDAEEREKSVRRGSR